MSIASRSCVGLTRTEEEVVAAGRDGAEVGGSIDPLTEVFEGGRLVDGAGVAVVATQEGFAALGVSLLDEAALKETFLTRLVGSAADGTALGPGKPQRGNISFSTSLSKEMMELEEIRTRLPVTDPLTLLARHATFRRERGVLSPQAGRRLPRGGERLGKRERGRCRRVMKRGGGVGQEVVVDRGVDADGGEIADPIHVFKREWLNGWRSDFTHLRFSAGRVRTYSQ
jgi:hypothetical protein